MIGTTGSLLPPRPAKSEADPEREATGGRTFGGPHARDARSRSLTAPPRMLELASFPPARTRIAMNFEFPDKVTEK